MRTPQTCTSTSRGPLEEHQHPDDDEVASHKSRQSLASSTSFSLQECIDEFRARKAHRSSQSNQNTDDDLINQNKSNKQNERISKPCKDGFCYCFTSDSDDFRIYKSDEKKRSRRSDTTTDEQVSDMTKNKHKVRRRETFPLNSKRRHEVHPKNGPPRTVTAISKLEDCSQNSRAPLIQIIQEIRNNCVVSEVRVNKHKIAHKSPPAKKQMVAEQKIINVQTNTSIPSNSHSPAFVDRVSEMDSLAEEFQQSSLNTSSRSSDRNGGRLLQKRLSGTRVEYKPRNLSTPPRKPPRNIRAASSERTSISTAPSIREAEKILDEFLLRKGIPVPRAQPANKSSRKSFPLTKRQNPAADVSNYEKPMPTCPSLSDIERLNEVKSAESGGVVGEHEFIWRNPKIREMLNLDVNSKNFQSNNPECGPQVGWTVPPKLDIDTVDGAYHNLVANMESKCTPVKTEMISNKTESQKFILAEQLKTFVSNSPWTSKKAKDKQNVKKSNSFLSVSKTKLLRFVTGNSPSTKSKSIGVQTSAQSVTDFEKQQRFSHQSPPGSYFSNTPAKTSKSSQTEFDFSRTIHSPKKEKVPQRKLLFPTHNVLKETLPRKANTDRNHNQTYRSYNSDLDKDLTLSKMGQVLSNIRSRLEASDDRAEGTFREIQRKEAAAVGAFSYDCVDGYDYQAVYHVAAQADVHNEAQPSYSEIEEDSFIITGSPINDNTNGIEHFVVESDPKAIYAKINKTPKKSKVHSSSFNNVMEQNSPPKLRNVSKTDLSVQSEMFLENLTSENNASLNRTYDKAEKVHNILQGERSFSDVNNIDDSYVSVDSFKESIAKESDAVSYELPDDNSNPINEENVTGNQSTPKKTMHLSKFGMISSDYDLHQTTSCPASPGWLLANNEGHYCPQDESMSLREESTAVKATNSSLWRYQTLKDKLRKSIRKSGHFLKNERKRISESLNSPKPSNLNQSVEPWDESSLCITNLFLMDDKEPVRDQLSKAVSICRLVPEFEASPEMVEAERLLLFSTLKGDARDLNASISPRDDGQKGVLSLKSIRLPIKENNGQELFFNYYYIGVFSTEGQVRSTKSAECTSGEAIFRNCNICFENLKSDSEIHCDIFMLRLRKVSASRKPPKVKKLSIASASSDEIVSRFRPHASFVVCARDFVPYHFIDSCQNAKEGFFCLHATNSCKSSLIPQVRSSNLLNEVHMSGEVEVFFRNFSYKGFLNVQDVSKKHSWNLRWCELDCLRLKVWHGPNDVCTREPVHTVDLYECKSLPVKYAPREVCARSRSFCLEFSSTEATSKYLFSADNQNDLNYWISALNEVLEFIAAWMK